MQEQKKLKIGYSDFKALVGEGGYFVDKTLFIKEFMDNSSQVLLIPRPRRFGKTLNLSMLEHFFSVTEKDSAPLFSQFKINKEREFCEKYQNQHPVINISLKSVRANDWENCMGHLSIILSDLYKSYDYLLDSDKLKAYEKDMFMQIILQKAPQNNCAHGLKHLSGYLHSHFGKKAIILVDEYDTPIIGGYTDNYYKEIIKFMQVFLGSAFKDNPHLHKGLITGIMRIARESIFSEMNNIGVFTITSYAFADKFGFTEQETREIANHFGLGGSFPNIKKWYNGYKFGTTEHIYNPWSIVNFIDRHPEGFKPYWVNTGTDPLIKKRVTEPDANKTYDTLQKLVSGETIEKHISDNFVFADFNTQKELLWTLLVFSGYLTLQEETLLNHYQLRIPNYEVKTVFKEVIVSWLETEHKVGRSLLQKTANHLVNNRIPEFESGFAEIMGDTFSYFDTAQNPEFAYQSYVLGLLAIIGDDYIIKSNRESGEGRYDIILIPHDKSKYGVVIEIKQIEKQKEGEEIHEFYRRVNKTILQAQNQIEKNNYFKELVENKIQPNKIVKLPIVFAGKEPYITQRQTGG